MEAPLSEPHLAAYVYAGDRPTVLVDPSGLGAEGPTPAAAPRPTATPQPAPDPLACALINVVGGINAVVGIVGIFVTGVPGAVLWIVGGTFTVVSGIASYKSGCLGR